MNRTVSQVRLGPPLEETINAWIPLLGYNVKYKEMYEINPSNMHVRRADTLRRVRTTNTGRIMLLGKWVHIANVVRDHRALRLVCDNDDDDDEDDYDFNCDDEDEQVEIELLDEDEDDNDDNDEDDNDEDDNDDSEDECVRSPVLRNRKTFGFGVMCNMCIVSIVAMYVWYYKSSESIEPIRYWA